MSRSWYFLALIPFALGAVIATITFMGMLDDIKAMQRVVVPGEGQLALDAGDYVAYGETESNVNGVVYSNTGFSVRCGMLGPDGAEVKLESPTGKVSYTMGGYSGRNFFELTAPTKGTYTLRCEGADSPAVIAVGKGVGSSIVIAVLAGVGGILAAIITLVVIRRKRKRERLGQLAAA
jgi:hypothetical protein